jgi:formylglycine-generating enzyme required for sulfatase activity
MNRKGTVVFCFFLTAAVTGCGNFFMYAEEINPLSQENNAGRDHTTKDPRAGSIETFIIQKVSYSLAYVPDSTPFPVGASNSNEMVLDHAFRIGTTPVTREFWSVVRTWASENGYSIPAAGWMGGTIAEEHQNETTPLHPVTMVDWYSAVVWTNAATEWYNKNRPPGQPALEPVYYTDSSFTQVLQTRPPGENDGAPFRKASADGFRLPGFYEYELASRWRSETPPDENHVPGYSNPWFSRADSAAGAAGPWSDAAATEAVAWFSENSPGNTQPVATREPTDLGLYDMSGNVWSWVYEKSGTKRIARGGGWGYSRTFLQFFNSMLVAPDSGRKDLGFRVARTVNP